MQQRDFMNRTVLYNATEYPNPEMIKHVLAHVPATELFCNTSISSGREYQMSSADSILTLYSGASTQTYGGASTQTEVGLRVAGLLSWILLGKPPPIQDVAESLIMCLQRGGSFTVEGSQHPWGVLGSIHRGETALNASDDFVRLGQSSLAFGCFLGQNNK